MFHPNYFDLCVGSKANNSNNLFVVSINLMHQPLIEYSVTKCVLKKVR